jgi:FkbH-like protein
VTELPAGASGSIVERLAWQRPVFSERPRRLDLLRGRASWPLKPVRIRVHRNQPFEFVASVMAPFLAVAGLEPEFDLGPYDDALSDMGGLGGLAPDVEVVWLDFGRYEDRHDPAAMAGWLADRLLALRRASSAPILVAGAVGGEGWARPLNGGLEPALEGIAGCHLVDQAGVADDLGVAYLDERSRSFTGSSLSDTAAIETARRFGLAWIPAVLGPRLKAVVVDLDATIYDGVLGEDGPGGVVLTELRSAVQSRLVELADSGVLLAVLSKNEPGDVQRLFAERQDFPLRPERLSAVVGSWRPKSEGMVQILESLRIGPDSVLFVDDNPGELAAVACALPGINLLDAADAGRALLGLRWYPGLLALRMTPEGALRAADLAAIRIREAIATTSSDPEAYLLSLGVRLTFARSPVDQLARIHELSTKTNQFNTGFLRLSEVDVAARLNDPTAFLVTIALRDRLSDSGVIGLVVGHYAPGSPPIVEEVAISCRALGRGVEDLIVAEALRGALGSTQPDRIRFAFRQGPRNGPARTWLERLAGEPVSEPGVDVAWSRLADADGGALQRIQIGWEE